MLFFSYQNILLLLKIVVEKIAKIRILYINDLAFGENYENQII